MKNNAVSGFTLVELLTVMIIVVVLASLAIPIFEQVMQRHEANSIYYQARQAFNKARSYAIAQRHDVSVCGLSSSHECSSDWSQGMLIYLEQLPLGFTAGQDEVLEIVPFQLRYGSLSYNRPQIRFDNRSGLTLVGNGTLRYCGQKAQDARAVIVSHMIHIRASMDKNGDGIHEDAGGNNIDCGV